MVTPFSSGSNRSVPSLGQTFGNAGRRGEQGERFYLAALNRFADAISRQHPPFRYEVFHSLDIPRSTRDRLSLKGDVDFAVASGKQLVLIDAKLWKPGLYFSIRLPAKSILDLLGRHKFSPTAQWLSKHVLGRRLGLRWLLPHVDGKWLLSHNMEMALERYRQRLKNNGVTVWAMVVFVPNGTATNFHNAALLRWPGGIPTFGARSSYEVLYSRLGTPEPVSPEITALLNQMKRNHKGETP